MVTLYGWAVDDKGAVSGSASDIVSIPDPVEERLAALEATVAGLQAENSYLLYLLEHFSRAGDEIIITGANLHVRSGSGATDGPVNGTGNLIVGYNESRGVNSDVRTGSHNVIIGSMNNYSSHGGLIAGIFNDIGGGYCTVLGADNKALADQSTVLGGALNRARGISSSVAGGTGNITDGLYSFIGGGSGNSNSGRQASILGGFNNRAGGAYATVSGGRDNSAAADASSVGGGGFNTASGPEAFVGGGSHNAASGFNSVVGGGYLRTAVGEFDWAAGALWEDQ
jgi:hypothetical protein